MTRENAVFGEGTNTCGAWNGARGCSCMRQGDHEGYCCERPFEITPHQWYAQIWKPSSSLILEGNSIKEIERRLRDGRCHEYMMAANLAHQLRSKGLADPRIEKAWRIAQQLIVELKGIE